MVEKFIILLPRRRNYRFHGNHWDNVLLLWGWLLWLLRKRRRMRMMLQFLQFDPFCFRNETADEKEASNGNCRVNPKSSIETETRSNVHICFHSGKGAQVGEGGC